MRDRYTGILFRHIYPGTRGVTVLFEGVLVSLRYGTGEMMVVLGELPVVLGYGYPVTRSVPEVFGNGYTGTFCGNFVLG